MNYNNNLLEKMIDYKNKVTEVSISHWLNHELFTWQWWFCILLYLAPLFIWWKMVDRKRLFEIVIFGLFVNITCSLLDVVGTNFAMWEYSVTILPNIPLFFPIDYVDIPVTYMLIYQRYPKWKHFIIAITITAFIFSFIGEPFDVWAKMYILIHWKYIYSLPIYILIAIVCKVAVNWFIKKAQV